MTVMSSRVSPYSPREVERHPRSLQLPPSGAGRSEFARDRDRIAYSGAFRALAGKTQVVAAGELGNFHTRLTHSLKVAQLGRVLTERLAQARPDGPDPDLVEAACLAHDIGHPPFGHAGETALSDTMDFLSRKHGGIAPDGFEGNAQNLRILTYLSADRPAYSPGLHLTRATLRAVTKYPWMRGEQPNGRDVKKWGIYKPQKPDLDFILDGAPVDGAVPLEEQIMDWCDDVTYACHDMEDFYVHGMIPLDRILNFDLGKSLPEEPAELKKFVDYCEREWLPPGGSSGFQREQAVGAFRTTLRNLILVREPFDAYDISMQEKLRSTVTNLISYFADDVQIEGNPPRSYTGNLVVDPEKRFHCKLLQKLIWFYVIERPQLAGQQHGQSKIVSDLLTWHFENPAKLLPAGLTKDGWVDEGKRLRTACDYVAGLTESHAYALHRRLSGESLGYISDML